MDKYEILLYKLMAVIGLELVDDRIVYDQDTMAPILYDGRVLVTKLLDPRKEMLFDFLEDKRIIRHLFQYYIIKVGMEYEREFLNFWIDETSDNTIRVSVKEIIYKDIVAISSDYYYIEFLAYLDLICRLEGEQNVDLKIYDEKKLESEI